MPDVPGFFGNRGHTAVLAGELSKKPRFVNVGGAGDCGFRSIAAGMIDNVLVNPRANEGLAAALLAYHAKYFEQPNRERYKTASEHFAQLVQRAQSRKFLSELAYALRQIAVDELCEYPQYYRGAFVDVNEGTSPKEMRRQSTWIDESAIAALAKVMQIPIEVQAVFPQKELPKVLRYDEGIEKPRGSTVVIQLQDKHYIPRVNKTDYFSDLKPVQVTPRLSSANQNDPDLSEILAKIEAEDKHLLCEFEEHSNRLKWMVEDGVMTKDRLLNIYIKGISSSDYLEGRARAGLKEGNQDFFAAIERARGVVRPVELSVESNEKQVTNELVHAIARAISIGQLDSDKVYEEVVTPSLGG